MNLRKFVWVAFASCFLCILALSAAAQTTPPIKLFGPVDVRLSQSNATYLNPVTFNTNTLTLTCPSSVPITATLSGGSTGGGNVLVDNDIHVSSSSNPSLSPNVCTGGQTDEYDGVSYPDCFTTAYQGPAGKGELNGDDVDTADYPAGTSILSTGGVSPINISKYLSPGSQTLTVSLEDEGGYVASSSIFLSTNCTVSGVQNGGTITGNPITSTSTTSTSQDFTFNPLTNQQIGFTYNLTAAYSANPSTVTSNTSGAIPQVSDSALAPTSFASYVKGTSFATSSCFIHNGELLNNSPSCKLFTLTCTDSSTSTNAAGANCPVSILPNEVLQDSFDGPSFTLPDITNSNGTTFHEGIGFLMASEGWTGGPCAFDSTETDLANDLCPRNLLTSFTGPGLFTSSGQTTHPNSTFISFYGVPEDLTTVTVTDSKGNPIALGPGNWTNQSAPYIVLSSQLPNLTGANLPYAANFVAAPIQSISYGLTPSNAVPAPGTTAGTDTVINNSIACPSPTSPSPSSPAAAVFTTDVQQLQLSPPQDGTYLLHYYAQDCAGTQELKFTEDPNTKVWSTNFYTYPINIDTVAPGATITLSAPPPYYQGQVVSAAYSCSDPNLPSGQPASGVVTCGTQTFNPGTASTSTYTAPVNTSTGGQQSFTVPVADAAGNTFSAVATYSVNIDSQIQFSLTSNSIVYPLGTEIHVQVQNINGSVPTGTVVILDNGNPVATLTLKKGSVYYYLSNLPAGSHSLNAHYLGDGSNPAGYSAAVQLTVQPVPVTLTASCWNTPYPYGANYQCGVYASSNAGAPQGNITYIYDGGAPVSLPLVSGSAQIILTKPPAGNHSLVISYPAQTNYAAAGPIMEPFVVTPAPVNVQLTPSAWYLTGGNLTLTAAVTSWSAGAPSSNGVVTFIFNNAPLGAPVPVDANGMAAITIPASALPNGADGITATYSNGTNYASGSNTITVQVAVPAAP